MNIRCIFSPMSLKPGRHSLPIIKLPGIQYGFGSDLAKYLSICEMCTLIGLLQHRKQTLNNIISVFSLRMRDYSYAI